jgi:hypothetical protein
MGLDILQAKHEKGSWWRQWPRKYPCEYEYPISSTVINVFLLRCSILLFVHLIISSSNTAAAAAEPIESCRRREFTASTTFYDRCCHDMPKKGHNDPTLPDVELCGTWEPYHHDN